MRLRIAFVTTLLAAVAALAAGCGGAESPSGPAPALRSLAQAATSTEQAGSYRFDLSMRMTMPGQSEAIELTASGAVDEAGRRASMTMDFGSMAGLFGGFGGQISADDLRMELRSAWPVVYIRMPFLAGKLPDGKEWVSLNIEALAKQQGMQLPAVGSLAQSDPSAFLDFLKAANGDLTTLGSEKVAGVQTTHYLARIDFGEFVRTLPAAQRKQLRPALEQLEQLTGNGTIAPLVDAWVGNDGLLRRFAIAFSVPAGGQSMDLAMTMNLHDFGSDVDVEAPDPDDVADAAALAGLGG
jgi:hypothetical protein